MEIKQEVTQGIKEGENTNSKSKKDEVISSAIPQINKCSKCNKKYYALRGCDCSRFENTNSKINKTNITREIKKWLSEVKKWGYDTKEYVIEKYKDDNNNYIIEFRFDSGIYEVLNYNPVDSLFSQFIKILRKYNGEFYNNSIVQFYDNLEGDL